MPLKTMMKVMQIATFSKGLMNDIIVMEFISWMAEHDQAPGYKYVG